MREDLFGLGALVARFDARAAGRWDLVDGNLVLRSFVPAPDLPESVASGFAEATRSVAVAPSGYGIVRAAARGRVEVSIADELPPDAGSGLWLRRFGAARSVAVPLLDGSGQTVRVVSVALPDLSLAVGVVVAGIRRLDSGDALPDNG